MYYCTDELVIVLFFYYLGNSFRRPDDTCKVKLTKDTYTNSTIKYWLLSTIYIILFSIVTCLNGFYKPNVECNAIS